MAWARPAPSTLFTLDAEFLFGSKTSVATTVSSAVAPIRARLAILPKQCSAAFFIAIVSIIEISARLTEHYKECSETRAGNLGEKMTVMHEQKSAQPLNAEA